MRSTPWGAPVVNLLLRVRANQGFVDGTDFSASKEASRREKAAANVGEDDSAFSSDQVRRRIVLNRLFPSFGAARCNDHYLVAFICAETLLFSAKRRECEARKEAELKAHAEAIVIKYLRVCEKNGVVKMWHEMEERYVEQMSRKHIFPRLQLWSRCPEPPVWLLCLDLHGILRQVVYHPEPQGKPGPGPAYISAVRPGHAIPHEAWPSTSRALKSSPTTLYLISFSGRQHVGKLPDPEAHPDSARNRLGRNHQHPG